MNIRKSVMYLITAMICSAVYLPVTASMVEDLKQGWDNPERTYRSHTRWWWPGNVLTKEEITWQLEQMAQQGFGGVEIMSAYQMYERGNTRYLSDEFLEKVKHAVAEGKRLDMDVALTFSPGWSFGGPWVQKRDQSKVLTMGHADVGGDAAYHGPVPLPELRGARPDDHVPEEPGRLEAVVAAKLVGKDKLDPKSLTVLTANVDRESGQLTWEVPAGDWRLMSFWLTYTMQVCQAQNEKPPSMVIDHLDKGAVRRYTEHLGGVFYDAVGEDFGTTVDSLFCDSFEIHPLRDSLLWSWETTKGFHEKMGYSLVRFLPAIWYDIGPLTPRIRYDLQLYLHQLGKDTVYDTFVGWCEDHNIQARIQPHYRFMSELVESAGLIHRPETEVTTARFEPVADPRKATASGARFYGDAFLSAESYTFIHPARYRTDLMDMKIATDAFIRDGISQFYNHGYFASPERHVAPGRDMPWANRISHWNTWWSYYQHFGDYVARACYLARQGDLVADVLIYSQQATAWSENALWGTDRRVMRYGNLAKTLVANGYDFDIVNDDLLQNHADISNGEITINGLTRRVLILPSATVVPIETMRAIEAFINSGGTVIALENLPKFAAGMNNRMENDKEVRDIVKRAFTEGEGHFIRQYEIDRNPFSPARKPPEKTAPLTPPQRRMLGIIRQTVQPDFVLEANTQSDGLTHIHKRVGDVDVYFITNLQPDPINTRAIFRARAESVQKWDAVTGEVIRVDSINRQDGRTAIEIDFEPWESGFYVFAGENLDSAKPPAPSATRIVRKLDGEWKMKLSGHGFEDFESTVEALESWTESPRTRHFSGTGVYETSFSLSEEELRTTRRLVLDLGEMRNIVEVEINGELVGVDWMAPYQVDITGFPKPGENQLCIKVTNTLINYVTSLDAVPPVPQSLQPRLGNTHPELAKERGYNRPPREFDETDLPLSGLVGPVLIRGSADKNR